jgi:hypothetical protein
VFMKGLPPPWCAKPLLCLVLFDFDISTHTQDRMSF